MALEILLPNGQVLAVQVYIDSGGGPQVWDGTVTGIVTAAVTNDGTFATPARQDTGNTSLATIAGKDFATQTTLALIKLKTDNIPALGQALAAGSVPIVLTATQLSTLTPPAAITGFATETTLGTRLTESDFDSKVGSLTETAPGTDTASSGLNGRLQRIAQRLTTLIASTISVVITAGTAIIGSVKDAGYQNSTWAVHHLPAANTIATITQASAGGSTKNVCLGLTATLASSSTTAPAAIQTSVSLIDGGTGTATYLWRTILSLPAVAGAITSFNLKWPHGVEGSVATAMTLEFAVAGGANTVESVSMYGTTRL